MSKRASASVFNIPIKALLDSARLISRANEEDVDENKRSFSSFGLDAAWFIELARLADVLAELDTTLKKHKAKAHKAKKEADKALEAIMEWRKRQVLPRAKLALGGDTRFRRFKNEKIRSLRAASVIRLGKLLVDALRKYEDMPEMIARGAAPSLAPAGEQLVERADHLDRKAFSLSMDHVDAVAEVNELARRLYKLLREVKGCAKAIFNPDSSELGRYDFNEVLKSR